MEVHRIYPLKVWLTTAIVGTTFYSVCQLIEFQSYKVEPILPWLKDLFPLYIMIFFASTILSIPCYLMYWYFYSLLLKSSLASNSIKLALLIIGQVLCFGLLSIITIYNGMFTKDVLFIFLSFSFSLLVSTFFYLPKQIANDYNFKIKGNCLP